MPKTDHPQVIEEDPQELEKLEKHHRYSHLFHRVKMLRLLESGSAPTWEKQLKPWGYGRHRCRRWFITYRREGLGELLECTNAILRYRSPKKRSKG